jgi:hypothetical protein
MAQYKKGTEVYWINPETYEIKKAKIVGWSSLVPYVYTISIEGGEPITFHYMFIGTRKKELLLRFLSDALQVAHEGKKKMMIYNEKADRLSVELLKLDANIDIHTEVENYRKEKGLVFG